MSEVKKLITGIVLVAIGLVMLLSSGGLLPILGAIIGVIGAAIIIFVLSFGYF